MLTRPQVQRYSTESGLRDIMIAEKEVVLTFLLQLLSERGILNRLAFKGGTCLRKIFIGSQGRFSTDLDFTGIEEHDHEEIILNMMQKFEDGRQFDWDDLRDLLRRDARIDRERISADCIRGFRFLAELTDDEQALARDP